MPSGTVKWFNPEKGFGFISPEDGSADLFVHQSAVEASGYATLAEGTKVTFVAEQSDKGPRAADVKAV
jgi:CspA family cold shock protein